MNNKGVLCISIDLELLWGRKDLDYTPFLNRTKKERQIIKKLLTFFDKYEIPATWATVFKLLEDGDPLWYGKDIIEEIKGHKGQEIGSHSYSHPDFSKISLKEATNEFKKSKASSFVFPRNKIKYLNLLHKYGFSSYRGADKRKHELLFPLTPPVYAPQQKNRLLNIQGSMYFVSARGLKRFIPNGLRYLKCRLGINAAIKQNKIFHLWFHPVDFADNTEKLFKEFETILKYASQKRNEGKLLTLNMSQITKLKI